MSARIAAAVLCAGLAGCTTYRMPGGSGPASDLRERTEGLLTAGTARADVTPPPGPSTFGHGPDALVAQGYWTRLYCRIFVLETAPEDRVALVACDLHSISSILHRSVAERVRAIVPTSRLLMAATHTHAGPAHYFDAAVYGGIASSRRPGFDPAMVEFLAARIAQGVERAYAARRPVAARWVHTSAWRLTRNRSLEAYRANGGPPLADPPGGLDLSEEEKAIDPALHVLQLEAVDPQTRTRMLGPAGWIVLFAMHPTVVGSRNRLFGGDAYGASSRLLEAELRRAWAHRCGATAAPECARLEELDPPAAILNTNEGDISPVWSTGTAAEAIRVGRALAERAWATYAEDARVAGAGPAWLAGGAGFRNRVALDSRYLEVDLPGAATRSSGANATLCPGAEVGEGSGHGASDHPVSLDSILPHGADVDPDRHDCQAPKKRMMGALQTLLVGPARTSFPTHAPFALLRLDDTWLSFVPGEPTVHAGAAINASVTAVAHQRDGRAAHAAVVGLANAYFQYIATREEYATQSYEAASTLYGPGTADYFRDRFLLLARSMRGESIDGELRPGEPRVGEAVELTYQPGPLRSRLPGAADGASLDSLGDVRRQRGLCRLLRTPPGVCFWWSDGAPGRVAIPDGRFLGLVRAESREPVRTCQSARPLSSPWMTVCDPGAVVDDRGLQFETRARGHSGDAWLWSTLVQPSREQWAAMAGAGPVRLSAAGTAGVRAVESEAFGAGALPAACAADALRFCLGEDDDAPR